MLSCNAPADQIYQTAIRLLARREHSALELQRKLQQRDYPLDLIKQQLAKLMQQDLLSEKRFIESYIRARRNKGYGPVRIKMELQQRGIKPEDIELYLNATDADWLRLSEQVRQKRFGKKIPADFAEKARQMRFLQYRGFIATQLGLADAEGTTA